MPLVHHDHRSRWFEQRRVWQFFAIVWAGIMASGLILTAVHDGHLGTGTVKHLTIYSLLMSAAVTAGLLLARRDKARKR